MISLLGLNLVELTAHVQRAGFPAFRAKQLFHWVYQRAASGADEMTNLPRDFRDWIAANTRSGGAAVREIVEASDRSMKILWGLDGVEQAGEHVEGVLMPEKQRWTLCVSTQVGCPLGCRFCVTGSGGFRRNLTAGEIVGQVIQARRLLEARGAALTNIVLMGMGEPLLNLDAVLPALRLIVSPQAIKVSSRRVTVSTAGVIAGIRALDEADLHIKLAVSLNATDDETRRRLMPIAAANPLPRLLEACRDYTRRGRRRVTFEYVLLAGVNDAPANARALARLVGDIPCKLNLIPFNPDSALPFERPSDETVERFKQLLLDRDFTVAVRYSKGREVHAACGQLALRQCRTGVPPVAGSRTPIG